jgi:hypothetical protein
MKRTLLLFVLASVAQIGFATVGIMTELFFVHSGEKDGRGYITIATGEYDYLEFRGDTIWTENYSAEVGPVSYGVSQLYVSTDDGLYKVEASYYDMTFEKTLIDTNANSEFKFYGDYILAYDEGIDSVRVIDKHGYVFFMDLDPDTMLEQKPEWVYNYWSYDAEGNNLFVHGRKAFDQGEPSDTLDQVDSVITIFAEGHSGIVVRGGQLNFFRWGNSFELSPIDADPDSIGFVDQGFNSTYWYKSDGQYKVYYGTYNAENFSDPGGQLLAFTDYGSYGVSEDSMLVYSYGNFPQEMMSFESGDWFGVAQYTVGGLDGESNSGSISMFPNPCTNQIQVSNDDEFDVLTVQGEIVGSNITGTFDTSQLPVGVYLIRQEESFGRFIKQ